MKLLTFTLLLWLPSAAYSQVSMSLSNAEGSIDQRVKLTIDAEQRADVKQPDFSAIEKHFDIISQSKQSSANFKSGHTLYNNRWVLSLMPKATGKITIPGILVGSERTRPLDYRVLTPAEAPPPPAVRVETLIEPRIGYLQSPFILTTRVAYGVDLARAELEEPLLDQTLIYRLGEQSSDTEQYRGIDYQVIEQRYLVFPEQQREYLVPPLHFSGETSNGEQYPSASEALYFDVIEPPVSPWIPATELRIEDSWPEPVSTPRVGDTLKRQLVIVAHNLPANWLPELKMPTVEGISVSLKNVRTQEDVSTGVLVSRKIFDYELLLTRAGAYLLPEIRIPWWDTIRDQADESILASRELEVGNFARPSASSNASENDNDTLQPKKPTAEDKESSGIPDWTAWLWAFIALICASGWSISYAQLKRLQKQQRLPASNQASARSETDPILSEAADTPADPVLTETAAFNQLARACSSNNPDAAWDTLLPWAQALWPSVNIESGDDLLFNARDPALAYLLKDLEYHRLHPDDEDSWQGDILLAQLQKIRYKNQLSSSQ